MFIDSCASFPWDSASTNYVVVYVEIKYKAEHINTHSAFIPFVLNLHHYSTLERPQRFFLGRNHLTCVASFISKMTPRLFQNGNGMHNNMFHLGICSRSHRDAEG